MEQCSFLEACLNPYCYGISSLTITSLVCVVCLKGLNPYCYGISSLTKLNKELQENLKGLNPYCYGISSLTSPSLELQPGFTWGLNPYCYGISSLTAIKYLDYLIEAGVLILIVMEYLL